MLATLWEWRSYIGWAVVALVALALLGFLRPVLDVFTRTYLELVLPLAKKVIASRYGLAAVAGIAFVLWTFGWWYFSDRSGYARAQGECKATIAVRERDALAQELKTTRARLAVLEEIRLQDATRALANAETERQNQVRLDAIPNTGLPCFDEPTARSLWGR